MKITLTKTLTVISIDNDCVVLRMKDGLNPTKDKDCLLLVGDSVTVEWPAISLDNHPDIKVTM